MRPAFTCLLFLCVLSACGGSPYREPPPPPEQVGFNHDTVFFSGGKVEIVEERGGRTYTINSEEHTAQSARIPARIPGHVAQSWLMVRPEAGGTQMAYVIISWDDNDPTDYLAGGWWSVFPQDEKEVDLFTADVLKHFVEGPEIDPTNPPVLPVTGTATYAGISSGLFQYIEAVGYARNYMFSEFLAPIQMTADFDAGVVQGCIGCTGEITAGEVHIASLLQSETAAATPRADPSSYELHFGPVGWREDGTVYQEAMTVMHKSRTIAESKGGVFGAQFSNRPVETGEPRLMAGSYRANFEEESGSFGVFNGSFEALLQKPE